MKKQYYTSTYIVLLFSWTLVLSTSSCTKLVEVNPPITGPNAESVYKEDATAIGVLTGIYTKISSSYFPSVNMLSISLFTGLSADELSIIDGIGQPFRPYYTNSLSATNVGIDFWNNIFTILFSVNSATEGLNNTTTLTPEIKKQLLGEAKFMRAFCYFYLVNLYGNVPIVTTTNYKVNSLLPRNNKDSVYLQIIADLEEAQALLSADYLDKSLMTSTSERVRPTKGAATALLSRILLFSGNYVNAEKQATDLISNTALYDTVTLSNTFLKNNKEAIWQFQPVQTGENTADAVFYTLPSTGPDFIHPIYINRLLINTFEKGDKRKQIWIDSVHTDNGIFYFPYKYKIAAYNAPITEYNTILRLSEQYLIRAEAKARQGKTEASLADLNLIRHKAGLKDTITTNQPNLLNAILKERQTELFTEWGHRWMDLKRSDNLDTVMTVAAAEKGGSWKNEYKLYPISLLELKSNPNLKQTPGY